MTIEIQMEPITGSQPIPILPVRESIKKKAKSEGDRLDRARLRCFQCGRMVSYEEILEGKDSKKFTDGIEAFLEWMDATACSEHGAKTSYLRLKKEEQNEKPVSVDVVRCCPRAWYNFRKLFERSFDGLVIGPKDAFAYWGFEVDELKEITHSSK